MISEDERREVARRLRKLHLGGGSKDLIERTLSAGPSVYLDPEGYVFDTRWFR